MGAVDKITNILTQNTEKNFVQRILKPDLYPILYMGDDKSGTHLMSYANVGDKYVVYPEIIQSANGSLQRLDQKSALDYALKNNEYIEFDSEKEADWFGKNYKSVWGY